MPIELRSTVNLKAAIEQRRATRSFSADPIPNALLTEILRLSVRAPSGYNLQPWRFIVVRKQENRDKLTACAFDQTKISEAPVVLICCGDRRVFEDDYIQSVIAMGKEHGALSEEYAEKLPSTIHNFVENKPSMETLEAWTNRHTMIAVAHMMIVAKSFGVDSCPMEGFSAEQVKDAFDIPQEVDVCCLLALGYAKEPFKQYGGRFDLDQVCFGESYGDNFVL